MAKPNPNRLELLEFINQATSELNIRSGKIEELSSCVQYLHLLHQTHANIVKMSKVNLKAAQEYECVANARHLAAYLAQIKAPFTFDVQKVASRNYQENLNLLKNLYKFHFLSLQEKNNPKDKKSRDSSASIDQKMEFKKDADKKKPGPKVVIRPPQNPIVKPPPKKIPVEKGVLEDYMKDAKKHADQIRSIMVVVKGEEPQPSEKQIAAQQKLSKIMKILGINPPQNSNRKQNPQHHQRTTTNSSMRTEPSKSFNKSIDLESNPEKNENKKPVSELKTQVQQFDEKSKNPEQLKKSKKTFDFDEVQQNALKRYGLHPSQKSVQRQTRMSTRNLMSILDEDPVFNEMLLSPEVEMKEEKKPSVSVRKSALIKRQGDVVSLERSQRQSVKKVRWEGEQSSQKKKISSGKKQLSSVKENEEVGRVSSAIKSFDRVLRSSSKQNEKSSESFEVILD